ncbi:MAG: NAD-dependent epimerase/dehydratase family protein [Halobacteria archaeon]
MTESLVVGAGYVGRALAEKLASEGREVSAVTRSGVDIDGVESLERDVTEPGLELPSCDELFYLVSAGGRDVDSYRESYVQGLRNTVEAVKTGEGDGGEEGDGSDAQDSVNGPRLYYTSSTGVYDESEGGWVDEETPLELDTERSRVLREAEDVALENDGTVVRFAGIYGSGRHGVDRYLGDGKVKRGYQNLIHREDAADSLRHLSETDLHGEREHQLYVACDDDPVERHELARWLSEKTGRSHGELVEEAKSSNKRCSNDRLRSTGWTPEYPNYREGYLEILEKEGLLEK